MHWYYTKGVFVTAPFTRGHFVRYHAAMMTNTELLDHLSNLGLTQVEAARLLSVSARTVRRWSEGSQDIPGPAEMALRAWLGLHRRGLVWRPDGEAISMDDSEMIARHRRHAIDLDALLERVGARGGPAAPWQVDLERGLATLGSLTVSFYKLRNGGFTPQSYRRADDQEADLRRDWSLVEDACACIARKLAERGIPMRMQVNFYAPKLDNGCLELWGAGVFARIDCQTMREAWRLGDQVSDEQCRMVAYSNLVLLGEIAERMADAGNYSSRSKVPELRIFDIGHQELQAVEQDVGRSALNQPPVEWQLLK